MEGSVSSEEASHGDRKGMQHRSGSLTYIVVDPHREQQEHQEQQDEGEEEEEQARARFLTSTAPFDVSFQPSCHTVLYSKPRQRQKWGDPHILPRVNWGDLFFDLFYVAANYNIGGIVVADPTYRGLLYAGGSFAGVMVLWMEKVVYDSRYTVDEDLTHRIFETCMLVILAVLVLNINSIDIMSNSREHSSMFVFCLMLTLERVFSYLRSAELYFNGIGEEAMKLDTKAHMLRSVLLSTFYVVATVLAGVEYFVYGIGSTRFASSSSSSSSHRQLAAATETYQATDDYAAAEVHRSDIPMILCFAGYGLWMLLLLISVICCSPAQDKHKERTVPMNIDFLQHRYGEWTMLMLGYGILSLLMVDVAFETPDFYSTFYCGVLTIILLQYLHFQSQPLHANQHAFRRSKNAGIGFFCIFQVYSFALMAVAASYTFFLTYEERKTTSGKLFSVSLAIVFACLDIMVLFHMGISEAQHRCVCQESHRWNIKGLAVILLRCTLLGFTATLSFWQFLPENLSALGLACVALQLVLRKSGAKYLNHSFVHGHEGTAAESSMYDWGAPEASGSESDQEGGSRTWPNVTAPTVDKQIHSYVPGDQNDPGSGSDDDDNGKSPIVTMKSLYTATSAEPLKGDEHS
jgi:hypothetical protein